MPPKQKAPQPQNDQNTNALSKHQRKKQQKRETKNFGTTKSLNTNLPVRSKNSGAVAQTTSTTALPVRAKKAGIVKSAQPSPAMSSPTEPKMNEPGVSTRKSIRWLPDEASEPTSTLVLTGASSRYVDIRIFKPRSTDEPELPNEGGPMTRLDWAFAGTSSSKLISQPSLDHPSNPTLPPGATISHSTFTHWVDSTSNNPAADEGDMYPQSDGTTLELGAMLNPATGRIQPYEEVWGDDSAEKVQGEDSRWSVVIDLEDEVNRAKGRVVRVGRWCQGIIKVGDELTVERWRWVEEEKQGGSWKRVARLGRLFLPCSLAFMPQGLVEGNHLTYGDFSWEVKEVFGW